MTSTPPRRLDRRVLLTVLLDAARALRDCALALDDGEIAERLAKRIAGIEREITALPTEEPARQITRHPN